MKNLIIKTTTLAFVLIAFTANTQAAPLSLFNNTTANRVVPNCYTRPDYNVILNTTTYNEVCNPKVYEVDTANGQVLNSSNGGYYTSGSFVIPQMNYSTQSSYIYSYTQPVVYGVGGGNGFYNNYNAVDFYQSGYNANYLDNPNYYGAVQNYTPQIIDDPYYYGYNEEVYGNGYDNYYAANNADLGGCYIATNGYQYCQ